MTKTFTCASCNGTFVSGWSDEEAQAEAEQVFQPQELVDTATVCDDCWRAMRRALPDFDERAKAAGL